MMEMMVRVMMSLPPPGPKAIVQSSFLLGYLSWADAGAFARTATASTAEQQGVRAAVGESRCMSR